MAYWDTSCLLKLYVDEADSSIYIEHIRAGETIITSEIAKLELFASLRRKESLGELSSGAARKTFGEFDEDVASGLVRIVAVNSEIVAKFEEVIDRCYGQVPPLMLRTLDALHLATAMAGDEAQVVCADKRLRDAALVVGLAVFPTP